MSRLPSLKPRDIIRVLKKAGFVESHQTGSHLILEKPDSFYIVTVPIHNRELKRGTLYNIITQSGLSREEFLELI